MFVPMQLPLFILLSLVLMANAQNVTETQQTSEETQNACEATQVKEYSMAWHIASIFIVLSCSGCGIFSTLTLGTMNEKPAFARMLQIFKMFGIGVIAGTGWCHLIPDAFESFTSECLPEAWAQYGPGFVGVFALASSFIVQTIELAAGGGHSHGHGAPPRLVTQSPRAQSPDTTEVNSLNAQEDDAEFKGDVPVHDSAVFKLEAGILFHSIIIGVSLGVTGDDDTFRTLLIAICFHQFFEGLALGAMIAKLSHSKMYKFFVMGLLYPLTTPAGMVIGIAVRSHFNENAHGTIITEGIFNSAS